MASDLFHIHNVKYNEYSKYWKSGEILKVDKDFTNRMNDKTSIISAVDIFAVLGKAVNNYNNSSDKKIVIDEEDFYRLNRYANDSCIFIREQAMEKCRQDHFSKLPSRYKCVFATDEEGLESWIKSLNAPDYQIFRIEVDKEPFKSNDDLIPNFDSSFEECYKKSFKYWNPKEKDCSTKLNEYLISDTKLKILERIK